MGLYKFLMLVVCSMLHNNNGTMRSNGNSGGNAMIDVEVELRNLPPLPPGFHFVPTSSPVARRVAM